MKRFSIIAVCLSVLALSLSAIGQTPQNAQRQRHQHRGKTGNLKKMDANQDGAVTRDEWKGRPERFARLDSNNDGVIGNEEAMAAGRARGNKGLKKMDADKNGQITQNEWTGDAELFARLDANNDGVISKDELKRRRRK